jgi:hypothetical protein
MHWTKKIGLFRGVASFVRLPLQRIVKQGLQKIAWPTGYIKHPTAGNLNNETGFFKYILF